MSLPQFGFLLWFVILLFLFKVLFDASGIGRKGREDLPEEEGSREPPA